MSAALMRYQSYLPATFHSLDRWVSNYRAAMRSRITFVRSIARSPAIDAEVLTRVAEGGQAFAKMRLSGIHQAEFRGCSPTGLPVSWLGAALFRLGDHGIAELWVLGGLAGLDAALKRNQKSPV
jgi:predicted ester cyclase